MDHNLSGQVVGVADPQHRPATIPVLSKDEVIERLAACVVDLRRWHELESSYGSKAELREQMRDYMFLLGGEENDLDRYIEAG